MSLSSGQRVGPYEIIAPLGAGGMGEVFRARDTRLDRYIAWAPDGTSVVHAGRQGGYNFREVPDQETAVPTLTLVQSWFAEFRDQAGRPGS